MNRIEKVVMGYLLCSHFFLRELYFIVVPEMVTVPSGFSFGGSSIGGSGGGNAMDRLPISLIGFISYWLLMLLYFCPVRPVRYRSVVYPFKPFNLITLPKNVISRQVCDVSARY